MRALRTVAVALRFTESRLVGAFAAWFTLCASSVIAGRSACACAGMERIDAVTKATEHSARPWQKTLSASAGSSAPSANTKSWLTATGCSAQEPSAHATQRGPVGEVDAVKFAAHTQSARRAMPRGDVVLRGHAVTFVPPGQKLPRGHATHCPPSAKEPGAHGVQKTAVGAYSCVAPTVPGAQTHSPSAPRAESVGHPGGALSTVTDDRTVPAVPSSRPLHSACRAAGALADVQAAGRAASSAAFLKRAGCAAAPVTVGSASAAAAISFSVRKLAAAARWTSMRELTDAPVCDSVPTVCRSASCSSGGSSCSATSTRGGSCSSAPPAAGGSCASSALAAAADAASRRSTRVSTATSQASAGSSSCAQSSRPNAAGCAGGRVSCTMSGYATDTSRSRVVPECVSRAAARCAAVFSRRSTS